MKHIKVLFVPVLLLVLMAGSQVVPASAEQQTLLGDVKITSGFFIASDVKLSTIKNAGKVFAGGRAGWIINHTFSLGVAGYGLVSRMSVNVNETNRGLHLGYGGFEMGAVLKSDSLIHLGFTALVGGGMAMYGEGRDRDHSAVPGTEDWKGHHGDRFFVAEPMVNLELNVTKHFRTSLAAGYRYVDGIRHLPGYSNKDLSGPSIELAFKFGKF